MFHKFESLPLS